MNESYYVTNGTGFHDEIIVKSGCLFQLIGKINNYKLQREYLS